MPFSKNLFSLVMSSPGGPDMVNGYILPQNVFSSMAIAALSILARN